MKIFAPLFITVTEKLLESNTEFLLIGGYAVNYYGYGRYTGDLDFWLRPTEENKVCFLQALAALKRNGDDIEEIRKLNFSQAHVISMGEEPLRIDFLTRVNFVDFDDAWQKRNLLPLQKLFLPVVDYDHLIMTKFNTGRPKDKMDLDELQRINQFKNKK